MLYSKSGSVSRLLVLYDLTTTVADDTVTSSWSPMITDCVLATTTVLFFAGQSRMVHIYCRIYACAGTEERKTHSWPFRAVRLLNSTVGVLRLLTRAFSPLRCNQSWRQASPPPHPISSSNPTTVSIREQWWGAHAIPSMFVRARRRRRRRRCRRRRRR